MSSSIFVIFHDTELVHICSHFVQLFTHSVSANQIILLLKPSSLIVLFTVFIEVHVITVIIVISRLWVCNLRLILVFKLM